MDSREKDINTKQLNLLIKHGRENDTLDVKQISDGRHTFGELYQQRSMLFISICNLYPHISWKSHKHFDEEKDPMYNGDFIAGIYTPLGQATFHLKNKYWDMLKVSELERAPEYDGYSEEECMLRIYSLSDLVNDIGKKQPTK